MELINCTIIKSKFSAFSVAQFLVRNSCAVKQLQTLCLKLSCLFEQLIIVDYEFSILLQSKTKHISRFNLENSLQCAVASTNLSIKTLSETTEICTSSGRLYCCTFTASVPATLIVRFLKISHVCFLPYHSLKTLFGKLSLSMHGVSVGESFGTLSLTMFSLFSDRHYTTFWILRYSFVHILLIAGN